VKRTIIVIITTLLLITLLGCELLLPKPDKPKLYFLGVGLDYHNATSDHLNGTIGDTKELASALYHRGNEMGVAVEVTLMLQEGATLDVDSDLYPSKANIWVQIERIGDKLTPNDIFIFYFAGHGDKIKNGLSGDLVVGVPSNNVSIKLADVVMIDDLYDHLKEVEATKLLILDSCYSGAHQVPYPRTFKEREENLSYIASQFYLLASEWDKVSYEDSYNGEIHGVMTYQLLAALGWDHSGTSTITSFYDNSYLVDGHIPSESISPVERNGNIYLSDLFRFIRGVRHYNQKAQTGDGPIELILFSRHW
jgi:hypothetical protein